MRGSAASLVGVVAVAFATLLACAPGAPAQPTRQLTAKAFAAQVRSRSLAGVEVVGDVVLGGTGHAVVCTNCTFDGSVVARGRDVHGPVDLAGSTFDGIVDFRDSAVRKAFDVEGATFHAPALFGSSGVAEFEGPANFSLASFDQAAIFEHAEFDGSANFGLARFASDAIFSRASASDALTFDRAAFSGAAEFVGLTTHGDASFQGVEFHGPADFSHSHIAGGASFAYAHFGAGATFLYTSFVNLTGNGEDSFLRVDAAGPLDFTHATFGQTMDFSDASSAGTMTFTGATFPGGTLTFNDASLGGLLIGVQALRDHVDPDVLANRDQDLSLLEATAKARNNLGLANAAHYTRQVLLSGQERWYVRPLDVVFYRYGAGYFVRPYNPMIVLFVLVGMFALWRSYKQDREPRQLDLAVAGPAVRVQVAGSTALAVATAFPTEYAKTLVTVIPGKGDNTDTYGVEVIAYRLLGACVLIGFANTNPTLRQMFDALR